MKITVCLVIFSTLSLYNHIITSQCIDEYQLTASFVKPTLAMIDKSCASNNAIILIMCCAQWFWCNADHLYMSHIKIRYVDINLQLKYAIMLTPTWCQCYGANSDGNIMLNVYKGHISRSIEQLLIDSIFCFNQHPLLCHDTESSNSADTQNHGTINHSKCHATCLQRSHIQTE